MKTIVTHNHSFHADDVFGVATLLLIYPDAKVVRTRDEELIAQADIVLDIGRIYNEETMRFDHHQEGGGGARTNGIPYASFGLIWKTFGEKICQSKEIAELIDKKIVAPIDAIDCGVSLSNTLFKDVYDYSLSSVVGAFNPTHLEEDTTDQVFLEVVAFAQKLIAREIKSAQALIEVRDYFLTQVAESPDKRFVVLDREVSRYIWQQCVEGLPELLFVVLPRESTWSLRAVRKGNGTFENRKDLPASWAGKDESELQRITGVADALFCHNARFVAIAKSKEGIVALLEQALKE